MLTLASPRPLYLKGWWRRTFLLLSPAEPALPQHSSFFASMTLWKCRLWKCTFTAATLGADLVHSHCVWRPLCFASLRQGHASSGEGSAGSLAASCERDPVDHVADKKVQRLQTDLESMWEAHSAGCIESKELRQLTWVACPQQWCSVPSHPHA